MLRRNLLEDSDNHERWLVSYSDFMTLLFGFFVVMYAISSVNEGKYRILSHTLVAAFDQDSRSLDPIQIGEPNLSASPHVIDVPDSTGYQDPEVGDTHIEPSSEDVAGRLAGLVPGEGLSVRQNNDWLEISLDSKLLFSQGDARLSAGAKTVLAETAEYLRGFDNPVTVEGYTDNVPATSNLYPSNWELSAARASAVARFLVSGGVERSRLSAVGYGENHALATNATPAGRDENRRVVVVVARKGNTPRNLNAGGGQSAFAFVRHATPDDLDGAVQSYRTESGGVIFTNESPPGGEPASATDNQTPAN
ncbi:MAG: flagellar motor protein MotD [Gammaproteobacteria bacterium]|nr:flagellar motor protein MotD [Gammaproteobacteria bacterium]